MRTGWRPRSPVCGHWSNQRHTTGTSRRRIRCSSGTSPRKVSETATTRSPSRPTQVHRLGCSGSARQTTRLCDSVSTRKNHLPMIRPPPGSGSSLVEACRSSLPGLPLQRGSRGSGRAGRRGAALALGSPICAGEGRRSAADRRARRGPRGLLRHRRSRHPRGDHEVWADDARRRLQDLWTRQALSGAPAEEGQGEVVADRCAHHRCGTARYSAAVRRD